MIYSAKRGEDMLTVSLQINRGIMFMRLEGELTTQNFHKVAEEINYLLYKQGILTYVFNLEAVKKIDKNIFGSIQNKLTEIFLKCGSVAFCGISETFQKMIGERKNELFYVSKEQEIFQYISI